VDLFTQYFEHDLVIELIERSPDLLPVSRTCRRR
jgi:hypothetical protein